MLLWHLGATLFLFRWIFRDPKVDVRFLLAGALLPDLLDMPLGTVILPGYATGELWAHTLVVPSIYMAAVLVVTRRGRKRRALMALGVGWLFHLLLDGMWVHRELFLWPAFGIELPTGQAPYWPLAWHRALNDPWRWVLEAVGGTYLLAMWRRHRLGDPARRSALAQTGRLDETLGNG